MIILTLTISVVRVAVAQGVEQVIYMIPAWSNLHGKVSLGKILNPRFLSMQHMNMVD